MEIYNDAIWHFIKFLNYILQPKIKVIKMKQRIKDKFKN
jgi:hypothetical protein